MNKTKQGMKTASHKSAELKMRSGNYTRSHAGIVMNCVKGRKEAVCSFIRCVAHMTDANTGKVNVLVKFMDHQGQYKKELVPRAEFNNPKCLIDRLANVGFCVDNLRLTKAFLPELYRYEPPKKHVMLVSQPGWHIIAKDERKAYVVNDQTYEPVGIDCNMVLDDDVNVGYASKGTLEEWHKKVAVLCQGNPRLVFLLSAGISGPFLDLLGYHNIGIHIFGHSRSGKTTGLTLVSSIYGDHYFGSSWNATTNALQQTAMSRHDSVLPLDEISQCDAKQASAAAYDLMNGVTKGRLSTDRQLNKGVRFRLVVVSTGEHSLQEHLQQGGIDVKAGQLARLISIPVHPEKGMFTNLHGHATHGDFAATLLKNADDYYGTAGPEFIRHLVDNQKELRGTIPRKVQETKNKLLASIEADEPTALQASVAKSMAVIACAGELAISCGVFPWSKGDAITAARACFKAWNKYEKEAAGARDPEFATIKQYFSDYQAGFAPLDQYPKAGLSIHTHKIDGTPVFLVTTEFFESQLCSDFGKKVGIAALKKRNLLLLGLRRGPTKQIMIPKKPTLGRKRFYAIRCSILTAE